MWPASLGLVLQLSYGEGPLLVERWAPSPTAPYQAEVTRTGGSVRVRSSPDAPWRPRAFLLFRRRPPGTPPLRLTDPAGCLRHHGGERPWPKFDLTLRTGLDVAACWLGSCEACEGSWHYVTYGESRGVATPVTHRIPAYLLPDPPVRLRLLDRKTWASHRAHYWVPGRPPPGAKFWRGGTLHHMARVADAWCAPVELDGLPRLYAPCNDVPAWMSISSDSSSSASDGWD